MKLNHIRVASRWAFLNFQFVDSKSSKSTHQTPPVRNFQIKNSCRASSNAEILIKPLSRLWPFQEVWKIRWVTSYRRHCIKRHFDDTTSNVVSTTQSQTSFRRHNVKRHFDDTMSNVVSTTQRHTDDTTPYQRHCIKRRFDNTSSNVVSTTLRLTSLR